MAVKLRLARQGSKKRPSYRIVAADSRAKRDGRFIEILGFYDPLKDPEGVNLKVNRIQYWLGIGAQPSERVEKILKKHLPSEEKSEG